MTLAVMKGVMKKRNRTLTFCLSILIGMLPLFTAAAADVEVSFLYPLSNFSGPIPSIWAQVAVDPEGDEVYVLHPRENEIRIFNETGMETFSFGEGLFSSRDLTIGHAGETFILSGHGKSSAIHRTNYRGELLETLTLKGFPEKYEGFAASQLAYRNESLYLINTQALAVVVVDTKGNFIEAHDLNAALRRIHTGDQDSMKELKEISIAGFDVDYSGNILFTVPSLFSAFRLSAEGTLEMFGRPGSARSKFGVVGGITSDEDGNIYVADRLRCVVLIFSNELVFRSEFGYRGTGGPANLIAPNDLTISRKGNIFVAQAANRGVSVFKVVYERPPVIEMDQLGDSSLELTQTEVERLDIDMDVEMQLRN
jgi:DNA-binding beta-propeller fold protein YncE